MEQNTLAPGGRIGVRLVNEMISCDATFGEIVDSLKILLNAKLIQQVEFTQLCLAAHSGQVIVGETSVEFLPDPIDTVKEEVGERQPEFVVAESSVTKCARLLEELARNIVDECFKFTPDLAFIASEEETLDRLASFVMSFSVEEQTQLADIVGAFSRENRSKVRTGVGFHLLGLLPSDEIKSSILSELQIDPTLVTTKLEIFVSFVKLLFGDSSVELYKAVKSLWNKLRVNFSFDRPIPTMAFLRRFKEEAETAGMNSGEDFIFLSAELGRFDPVSRQEDRLTKKASRYEIGDLMLWRGDEEEILQSRCQSLDWEVIHAAASEIPLIQQLEQLVLQAELVLDAEEEIAQQQSLLGWHFGANLVEEMRENRSTVDIRAALEGLSGAGIIGHGSVEVLCPNSPDSKGLTLLYEATRINRKIDDALGNAGARHQRVDGQVVLPLVPRPKWHEKKYGEEGYWNENALNDDLDMAQRYERKAGRLFGRRQNKARGGAK